MSFYSFLVAKIRNIRYSITNGQSTTIYSFGAVYNGPYIQTMTQIHDPNPLIFCMWSDTKYTHGLNIHYLPEADRAWLARNIFMIKKYQQVIDGRTLYNFIKTNRISIVQKCYRKYFTNMCRYKLVSAGITNLEKLVYPSNEPFAKRLNEAISSVQLALPPVKVSYSPDELRNRIIESMNSIPIQKMSVTNSRFGTASWVGKT